MNLFKQLTEDMDNLPIDERVRVFKETFAKLSKKEKLVLTMEMLEYLDEGNKLKDFLNNVNNNILEQNNEILDEYNNDEINKEEMTSRLKDLPPLIDDKLIDGKLIEDE